MVTLSPLVARLRGYAQGLARLPLVRERRGVAALEFALVLPLMLALYAGTYETVQGVSASRRLMQVGSTVGDLVAQVSSVTQADMDNIFNASTAIMMPFPTTTLKMTVSSVLTKPDGSLSVTWSKTRGGTAWTVNKPPPSGITVPAKLKVANQEFIVSSVQYTYSGLLSPLTYGVTGSSSIAMNRVTFFRPRITTAVAFK